MALVFAVPFSIAARWAADSRDDTGLALLLSLGALAGFLLGAGCAAWVQQVGFPLTHGLTAALSTYVAAQAVLIVIKLSRGGDVNWLAALFNASAVAGVGLLGGLLGGRLREKGLLPTGGRS